MARATRRHVVRRDQYRCTICGATQDLEVHHIVPRAEGGTNDPDNLVTVCMPCHLQLHGMSPAPSKDHLRNSSTQEPHAP
jgi:5-methylcytosine-specific restriction endonuclease McrA